MGDESSAGNPRHIYSTLKGPQSAQLTRPDDDPVPCAIDSNGRKRTPISTWWKWRPLGESNPCCQDENLDEGDEQEREILGRPLG